MLQKENDTEHTANVVGAVATVGMMKEFVSYICINISGFIWK